MAFLDAAVDRQTSEFDGQIEAIRAGMVFAYDPKAYRRWSGGAAKRHRPDPARGLSALVASIGGRVERGGFEFRTE